MRSHLERGPRHVTPANRSVFYDLGLDEAEARVLEMRADLMAALRERVKKQGWTQSEAAKRLGTTQRRVSALMKGAWQDFSADMLLVLAAASCITTWASSTTNATASNAPPTPSVLRCQRCPRYKSSAM
jgi:predicted XRE-type DNA-binding protein